MLIIKIIINNNNDDDLLTDPLGSSSLLNYLNYKLFTNYTVELGLTESKLIQRFSL